MNEVAFLSSSQFFAGSVGEEREMMGGKRGKEKGKKEKENRTARKREEEAKRKQEREKKRGGSAVINVNISCLLLQIRWPRSQGIKGCGGMEALREGGKVLWLASARER